jgi:hypothetical protein
MLVWFKALQLIFETNINVILQSTAKYREWFFSWGFQNTFLMFL